MTGGGKKGYGGSLSAVQRGKKHSFDGSQKFPPIIGTAP